MVELRNDRRGATSVVGLMLLLGVTVVVVSTVAVFVFGIDTNTVVDATEKILDMDQSLQ